MEIEITNDRKNALLGRREIDFYIIEDDRTPSKEEVKTELCKKLSLSPESTIIVRIDQSFGVKRSSGSAHSYGKKEDIRRNEAKRVIKHMDKKPKAKEAKKEEEKKEG
jgi:ribosomal protein S24E